MQKTIRGTLVLVSVVALGILLAGCLGATDTTSVQPGSSGGQANATPTDAGGVVAGNNRFAVDLYRELADDPRYADGNIFFSPFSLSSALAITLEGARGETAEEIRAVFGFPENETIRREGFAAIYAGINSGDRNYTLRTANALWAEKTYPFLPGYIDIAGRYYAANVTNLDFINAPEPSRIAINAWVEEQTEERIRDLLPAGSIDPLTRLVITNAIYFEGTWVKQFDTNSTREEEFRTASGAAVWIPMMQRTDEEAIYNYTETDALQVLEMPYVRDGGRALSMLVLLPREDNLTAAEAALDAENLSALRQSLVSRRVDVFFPKFRLETEYRLPGTLAAMGMPTAFAPGAADFSGMDGTKDLYISDVVHKAFVDVNEEGTEAAAATGVVMRVLMAPSPEEQIPVFRADHPFLFLIQENESGAILFIGRVADPGS
ncbi:MAG: serpin family protein [Methanomicrobiales archaeon]|nr:serpin family protein [Methanomicrobiales archaeon]